MQTAFLSKRSIISVVGDAKSGDDSLDFLQGLISNDARKLQAGAPLYAALLSPQGKFLHDFFLIKWGGKIFIDIAANRASDLLSRLKIYRLRSKVEISLETQLRVTVIWGEEVKTSENTEQIIYQDPRLSALGYRTICLDCNTANDEKEYDKFRLSLGVPDTEDMIIEKSLLLECGFEELHGVDFSKGCYVGQEVTARSKFRGQVRKSFYKISANSDLPMIGTPIIAGGKSIGELRTSCENIGIGIINTDAYNAAKTENAAFYCGELPVNISLPVWS